MSDKAVVKTVIDNLKFMKDKYTGCYAERISLGIMAHDCICVIESLCDDIEELQVKNQELQKSIHALKTNKMIESFFVSIDYGTLEPFTANLWRIVGNTEEVVGRYYYCGRSAGHLMTDEEYYTKVKELTRDFSIDYIFINPSAASFIECVKRHGEFVVRRK